MKNSFLVYHNSAKYNAPQSTKLDEPSIQNYQVFDGCLAF